MLFPTVDFAVFFVVVFTASWLLRPHGRAWRLFLVAASAVFYLDPFNPVHSGGERFMTVNPVILGVLAGVVLATARLLRAAFPAPVVAGVAGRGQVAPLRTGIEAPENGVVDLRFPVTGPNPGGGTVRMGAGGEAAAGVAAVELNRAAGRPGGDGGGDGPDGDEPPPAARVVTVPDPMVLWGAPAAVTVLVAATNLVIARAFPTRPDQNARWLLLLVGVALVNQAFALSVHAARAGGRTTPASRCLVAVAVAVDLVVLGWFKYANWFAEMWVDLAGRAGVHLEWMPAVVLPIAISFFTFQAISYVVDVGRGQQAPVSLLDFTVYLTFFAHVVAGPIVRVREFVPQLGARADPRFVASAEAFELIFRGLFKKVVVSSYIAAQIVQPVFDAPAGFSRTEVLFAILGYAVQIYADFSGYTDIAIGAALLLGIRFPQNFDAPYRAVSLQDFWRRWHMTLSRWLRDYLYIPLGGNRISPSRTQVNILVTMLLGGLWHGANGTFVVWGAIHGGGLALEQRVKRWWARRPAGPLGVPVPVVRTLQWTVTLSVVCLAWVFFNARDVGSAFAVLGQLAVGEGTVGAASRVTPVLVGVIGASIASHFVPPRLARRAFESLAAAPPVVQAAAGACGLVLIVVLGPEGVAPFIYFQF
jgi:alginate O-acetyltransferase complex protein AlgI